MAAKPTSTADKTELREKPAYGLTDAAQAAKLAWKRTMEFFDQRLRK